MTEEQVTKIHFDPEKRHDFVFVFDVTDGNPNGDPDAGNLPRTDPETLQGIVTDVSLKRKVRNFVALVGEDESEERKSALNIYVEHRGILNAQHRKSYNALNIPTSEPGEEEIGDPGLLDFFITNQPDGFSLMQIPGEEEKYKLVYLGELSKEDLTAVLEDIGQENSKAKTFAKKVSGKAKERKPTREQVNDARDWMCANFYDIRMFGAVMSTKINAGQVRGPVQITFARSIDPILPQDISITRVAITREEDKNDKETEMGRKTLIPYGLYMGHGFFSPHLAKQTGVTSEDLELFWNALVHMWDFDRSASRGLMAPQGIYVFTHENKLGNAPSHKLFELIKIPKVSGSPRSFDDYEVESPDEGPLDAYGFSGVTLAKLLG